MDGESIPFPYRIIENYDYFILIANTLANDHHDLLEYSKFHKF